MIARIQKGPKTRWSTWDRGAGEVSAGSTWRAGRRGDSANPRWGRACPGGGGRHFRCHSRAEHRQFDGSEGAGNHCPDDGIEQRRGAEYGVGIGRTPGPGARFAHQRGLLPGVSRERSSHGGPRAAGSDHPGWPSADPRSIGVARIIRIYAHAHRTLFPLLLVGLTVALLAGLPVASVGPNLFAGGTSATWGHLSSTVLPGIHRQLRCGSVSVGLGVGWSA